jgi:hypothetical protein
MARKSDPIDTVLDIIKAVIIAIIGVFIIITLITNLF